MSGFLILFDITKRASFERVLEWYYELRSAAQNAPFILIGNKIDMDSYREVSSDEARSLAMELGAEYYVETSAKADIDTMTPFQLLSKCIALREVPLSQQTILA
jgi:GTPase SAR1 family protein